MSNKKIPDDWFCPISQTVMTDPVIASDGFTYQRKDIEEWLSKNDTSPITRQQIQSKNLISNKALKSTIQQMLPEYLKNGAEIKKQVQKAVKPDQELRIEADATVFGEQLLVNVSIVPPQEQTVKNRKKCAIICVLDVSGSMDTQATMSGGNDTQNHGFTRLDLVKHSVNTVIHSLSEGDMLALVPFSDSAQVALTLTKMDKKGKQLAQKTLTKMRTKGSTNIWDGIRVGLNLSKDERCDDRNVFVILLTDGEPNINPPQGILPTLKKYISSEGLNSNLHVFGYGYQLDTVLLTGIANEGLGTYGYIPDCSMVGTIFVNFLSNALATVTNLVQLNLLPYENAKYIGTHDGNSNLQINLGGIQYGQPRDYLLRLTIPTNDQTYLTVHLNYGYGLRRQTAIDLKEIAPKNVNNLKIQINRAVHMRGLDRALQFANDLPAGLKIVKQTLKELKNSEISETDEFTKFIIRDISSPNENEGQVTKAFEKSEWYTKWGKHYIPALLIAHKMQICTNFKDPGLQKYGGQLFRTLQNQIDSVFIKLPPPKPTIKKEAYVAPANMASYYNYGGGCIAGHCQVLMADGSIKLINQIKKGDQVRNGINGTSKILCVLKTNVEQVVEMIHFQSGLVITPYHPIKFNGDWQFPVNVGTSKKEYIKEYFNFVLEDSHSMMVNQMECITLAHGLKDNAVVQHEYLGTAKILDDLKQLRGFDNGMVQVGKFERDPVTLRISKILEQC